MENFPCQNKDAFGNNQKEFFSSGDQINYLQYQLNILVEFMKYQGVFNEDKLKEFVESRTVVDTMTKK